MSYNFENNNKDYYVERNMFLAPKTIFRENLTYNEAKNLCDDCNKNYSDAYTWYDIKKITK